MYEPEKILVQNAGIDPGVAALLQNANKGNMDPAALMAMMNNGGFGGNGGWWWIWIILIFFCWGGFGGNGFGRGSDDASRLASQLNTDTNTSLLMQAIQGNKDAISSLCTSSNEIILGNAHNVRSPLRGSLTVQWTSFCCLYVVIIFPRFAQSSFASLGNIIIKLFKKGYQFLLRSVSKIL